MSRWKDVQRVRECATVKRRGIGKERKRERDIDGREGKRERKARARTGDREDINADGRGRKGFEVEKGIERG